MTIRGQRTTKNINQDRRKVDMSERIALLQPSKAPLVVLTKKLNSKSTINPIFNWMEDDLDARWGEVDEGSTVGSADNEFGVEDPNIFNVGDIVKVPDTGEIMRVTNVDTSNDEITCDRGYGTTSAQDIDDGSDIVIIGSAHKEGGSAPEALSTKVSTINNYTQIFKTSVKVTKTQEASELYGGSDRNHQRKKKGIQHSVDIEKAGLFGEKSEHVSGDEVIRTTAGVLSLIEGNAQTYDASGELTEDEFEKEWLEELFRYGNDKKTLFASARLISIINSWGRDKLHMETGEETFGLSVYKYLSAHGELNIVKHPLLENEYSNWGIALDIENVRWRPLQGRDTSLETNIQGNDDDYYLDQYLTEGGFEVKLPETHGILKNVGFPS